MNCRTALLFVLCLLASASLPAAGQKTLRLYTWTNYVDEAVLGSFARETGIQVSVETFTSNEELLDALKSRPDRYDLVTPSANMLSLARSQKLLQALRRDKLGNWRELDELLLEKLQSSDPGNAYGVPYLWGTTVFSYRPAAVQSRLGSTAPLTSWKLIFDPANAAKLADCGVALLDSPTEVIPAVLHYLGTAPTGLNPSALARAEKHLKLLAPHVRFLDEDSIVEQLGKGELCAAMSFSGDLAQARQAAKGRDLVLVMPDEGAEMWVDMLAIPARAPNPDGAHRLINFLLQPENMARLSNSLHYANAVPASWSALTPELLREPALFPDRAALSRLYRMSVTDGALAAISTRIWNAVRKAPEAGTAGK